VIIIGLHLFITQSRTGKAIRAIAFDKTISSLLGIRVEPMIMKVFFLSGLIAGMAGCLTGIAFSVGPFMAHEVLLKGFAAIILGGLGSLGGSLIGGFIIGISEGFSITFISSDFKDLMAFLVMFLFLVARPQGLFGKKEETRA
jgi:branched-chain amino acid transport system permease protein